VEVQWETMMGGELGETGGLLEKSPLREEGEGHKG